MKPYIRQIVLKKDTPDAVFTFLCETMTERGVFRACGSCDDKWIIGIWENESDYLAWATALAIFSKEVNGEI